MKSDISMTIHDLSPDEYGAYYFPYIQLNQDLKLLDSLSAAQNSFLALFNMLTEENLNFRYEKEKWSVAELIQHIIDAERVFQYRALRFSRNDNTPLPGFNQDDYVAQAPVGKKTLEQFKAEFSALRKGTISFFESLGVKELKRIGQASGTNFSVRALGFIISGHQLHHESIMKERYL